MSDDLMFETRVEEDLHDYAEEEFNRNLCPACGTSPCMIGASNHCRLCGEDIRECEGWKCQEEPEPDDDHTNDGDWVPYFDVMPF